MSEIDTGQNAPAAGGSAPAAGDSSPEPGSPSALLLAHGHYRGVFAKTSHGLVRGPSRWPIAGVVDPSCFEDDSGDDSGTAPALDAGTVLDGRHRDIPIFASVEQALQRLQPRPTHCVVGVATVGGVLPPEIEHGLAIAADAGLSLINGLHHLLSEQEPELVRRVERAGGSIVDLRKPPRATDLHFWQGEILDLDTPRIAVLGTDCALGKRTTTSLLRQALADLGIQAEMIYTGQTGWLQGYRHGFIFDATPNDFVSGELEHAILTCAREEQPEILLIEGQSGLRNPSGPCGSELLLSAAVSGVFLQHAPGRPYFEGLDGRPGCEMVSLGSEIDLIGAYGFEVWGVGVHTEGLTPEQAREHRDRLRGELGIPVVLPLEEGVEELALTALEKLGLPIEKSPIDASLPTAQPTPETSP